MTLTLEPIMILIISSLVVIAEAFKKMINALKDKALASGMLDEEGKANMLMRLTKYVKLLPIFLFVLAETACLLYDLSNPIDQILKGIICTACACWGFDAVKGILAKGVIK